MRLEICQRDVPVTAVAESRHTPGASSDRAVELTRLHGPVTRHVTLPRGFERTSIARGRAETFMATTGRDVEHLLEPTGTSTTRIVADAPEGSLTDTE